jgi:hypothetical protein
MNHKSDTKKEPDYEVERRERRKKSLLKNLAKTHGIISFACSKAKVSRDFYYDNYKLDPVFRKACDDIIETQKDGVEAGLLKAIADGNMTGIIFYLKTKCKDRGYVERIEHVRGAIKKDEIDLSKISPELLEQLEAALFKDED